MCVLFVHMENASTEAGGRRVTASEGTAAGAPLGFLELVLRSQCGVPVSITVSLCHFVVTCCESRTG